MLEQEALAVLVSAKGIGYATRERVLAVSGSALAVIEDPYTYEEALGGKGVCAIREALEAGERMLSRIAKDDVHLIMRGMPEYPRLLMHTARPPHLLFCMGQMNLNDPLPMAIVGTRRASRYGMEQTQKLSRELAQAGMCIVSGLATGIDACAHRGALEAGGRTVAVLGGALDKFYPMENYRLMEQIIDQGGSVISEYAPGVSPNRYSFLERNRIIAGMSLGTLITEGPLRSGAMQTARCALDEGREVFAVPGDIDRENAAMPNRLIAEGAHLVTCAQDILAQLVIESGERAHGEKAERSKAAHGADSAHRGVKARQAAAPGSAAPPSQTGHKELPASLGGTERVILTALQDGEMDFDALSERTEVASDELGAALMMLELDGLIDALPGCRYRLA